MVYNSMVVFHNLALDLEEVRENLVTAYALRVTCVDSNMIEWWIHQWTFNIQTQDLTVRNHQWSIVRTRSVQSRWNLHAPKYTVKSIPLSLDLHLTRKYSPLGFVVQKQPTPKPKAPTPKPEIRIWCWFFLYYKTYRRIFTSSRSYPVYNGIDLTVYFGKG